jgi:hypothetical protein
MNPSQVVYDDACKLQGYHDAIESKQQPPPTVVTSIEFSRTLDSDPKGGIATFGFESPVELTLVRQFLSDNYRKLPRPLMEAPRVEIRVKWAEKAGVRRVVTEEDAQINYAGKTGYLPYHVCLSELFFGAPLYRTRRNLLGIALAPAPVVAVPLVTGPADAGVTVTPDAGAIREASTAH